MRNQRYLVLAIAVTIASLAPVNAEAQGNWRPGDFGSWRFFMGIFEPEANSQFWDDYFVDFTGSPSSFQDLVFGTDYLWRTSRHGGLLFGISFYEGKSTLAYQDWVDADGQDISHTSTLSLWDLSAAYVLRYGRGSVRPYVGAGGGMVWWQFREEGYFIDALRVGPAAAATSTGRFPDGANNRFVFTTPTSGQANEPPSPSAVSRTGGSPFPCSTPITNSPDASS